MKMMIHVNKYYNVKSLKVDWENNKNSYIHVFINTTDVKKFEFQKAKNDCLQIMFSSITHEFRTPINAFSNSMSLIEINYCNLINEINNKVWEDVRHKLISKRVEEINDKLFRTWKVSTTSLMWLVEDILDLAKIEAGTFKLNEQLFNIKSLVQDIQFVFEFQWAQKGIYFKVEVEDNLLNSEFCSDIGRIKQVLNNLISNAYKFTIQGGITLRIFENVYFDAGLFERRKSLKFEVSDTGVGIPEKDIPKLFKLFGVVNSNQRKLNSKGTGLGLVISKKIVEILLKWILDNNT